MIAPEIVSLQCIGCGTSFERRGWLERLRIARGRVGPFCDKSCATLGQRNPSAKLTPDDVREIRRLYASGAWTKTELGEEFGVTRTQVYHVVTRRAWRHVT